MSRKSVNVKISYHIVSKTYNTLQVQDEIIGTVIRTDFPNGVLDCKNPAQLTSWQPTQWKVFGASLWLYQWI